MLYGSHINWLRSALVPVLKIRSQAAVWSCQVFVLKVLWSSTGVTIINPKVLIIWKWEDTMWICFGTMKHFALHCIRRDVDEAYSVLHTVQAMNWIKRMVNLPFLLPWWNPWPPHWCCLARVQNVCRKARSKWLKDQKRNKHLMHFFITRQYVENVVWNSLSKDHLFSSKYKSSIFPLTWALLILLIKSAETFP